MPGTKLMGFAALYPSYNSAVAVIAMPKTVIAREGGRSSIPETVMAETRGRGVPSRPVKPGAGSVPGASAQSWPSSVSPPETSTLPGAGSLLSFFTTPSSTSIE